MNSNDYSVYISPIFEPEYEKDWSFDYVICNSDCDSVLASGEESLDEDVIKDKQDDEIRKLAVKKIIDSIDSYLNKPHLKDFGKLLNYCVSGCRESESGMFFIEGEDFYDYFTKSDFLEFEEECNRLDLFNEGIIEIGDGDPLITCYRFLPRVFNLENPSASSFDFPVKEETMEGER